GHAPWQLRMVRGVAVATPRCMSGAFRSALVSPTGHWLQHRRPENEEPAMEPRIHVITLAVAGLDCALAFYRDGLGFQTEGLIGTEFTGNQAIPDGTTAV